MNLDSLIQPLKSYIGNEMFPNTCQLKACDILLNGVDLTKHIYAAFLIKRFVDENLKDNGEPNYIFFNWSQQALKAFNAAIKQKTKDKVIEKLERVYNILFGKNTQNVFHNTPLHTRQANFIKDVIQEIINS